MMIRVFGQNDVYRIADITSVTLKETYPPSFFLNIFTYWPEGFLVAEQEGKIVGFVMGVIANVRQSRILMLAVDELHRKEGIASALIRAFVYSSMLKRVDSVILEVRVSNSNAINLYSKLGFRMVGSIRAYYKDGEDGYRMELLLQT